MQSAESRRIVCIGDEAVGKTSLLLKYVRNSYSDIYNPTVEETYVLENEMDTEFIDTAGAEAFDRLRPFSYTGATGAIVCFAISSPKTFKEVEEKWIPELKYFCRDIPFFLVGLKKDLRDSYELQPIKPPTYGGSPTFISTSQGQELAQKVGAIKYVECSAKTGESIPEVFIDFTRPALPRFTRFIEVSEPEEYPYDENVPLPPKTRKQSLAPPKKATTALSKKPSMPKLPSYGKSALSDSTKRISPAKSIVKAESTTKRTQLQPPKPTTTRRGSTVPVPGKISPRRPGTPSSTGSNDDNSFSSLKDSKKPVRRGSALPSPPVSPISNSTVNSLALSQRRDSTPTLKVPNSSKVTSKSQTLSPQPSPLRTRSKSIATPTLLPAKETAKLLRKKSVSTTVKTTKPPLKATEKRLVKSSP